MTNPRREGGFVLFVSDFSTPLPHLCSWWRLLGERLFWREKLYNAIDWCEKSKIVHKSVPIICHLLKCARPAGGLHIFWGVSGVTDVVKLTWPMLSLLRFNMTDVVNARCNLMLVTDGSGQPGHWSSPGRVGRIVWSPTSVKTPTRPTSPPPSRVSTSWAGRPSGWSTSSSPGTATRRS